MPEIVAVAGGAVVVAYAAATLVLSALGLHAGLMAALRLLHRPRPLPAPEPPSWPDVVVQLPVYDEPPTLVARALDHALALRYPGRVAIQLLDDSPAASRRENAALCAARHPAVRHLPRTSRDGFKAGALAAGLARTDAALAAVFDVDFRPDSDTLLALVPPLVADDGLAFVQAMWVHPGADASALAQAESAVLDLHFAVEQMGRDRAGLPVLFNGTAGVWRVAAIDDAGGWRGDTLAEDLDLTIRAYARGWRSRLVDLAVPADLPPTVAAWRRQQARWAKGLAEVARLVLPDLWRSSVRLRDKAAITAHAALSLSLPALLTLVVLHPLAALAGAVGIGPSLGFLSIGYVALAGVVAAHAVALRALDPAGWTRRLGRIPVALVGPLVLIVPAARAVLEAVRGRRSAFVRTLKTVRGGGEAGRAEVALAAWSVAGLVALAAVGSVAALFQAVLAVGTVSAVWAIRQTPHVASDFESTPTVRVAA